MGLKERLNEEMKQAMKAKDKNRLSAIRMVRSEIRNKEINDRVELDDERVAEVIASQIKKRKDALEQLRKSNRADLVDAESEQIELLQQFLPEQLSEAEIEAAAVQAIEELGATSMRDMGKVMGKLVPQFRGRADNSLVSQIVRQKLS
ncbi:MAG: GatB/YqeY domain-containing protein [Candidatus Poribacteria bacterium]|nr:GatB/YqeY domain-containing protein [Candidatus Poribacteria bacterium]